MHKEIILKFKALFEEQKRSLLYTKRIVNEDFHLSSDDLADETDLASSEIDQAMRMRLRNREALFMKKIDEALARIASGSFGDCEDCGDNIEIKRLEARPTTTLCVSCKEVSERAERLHVDGHRHKSLGRALKLA